MKPVTVTLGKAQRLFSEMLNNQAGDGPFISILENNSRIPGHVATSIYRNNTIGTRKRALQAIYPVIEKVLGESCFDMLAVNFVNLSPSMDSDLNLYGAGFPGYLQDLSNNEAAFSDFPYLKDLATLEWLYHKVYYAADDLELSETQFADIDASVMLERSRSVCCMQTLFPVYGIWQNHQGNKSVKEVSALVEEDYILIFRQQGHPVVQLLDRENWSILQSVEGKTELDVVVQSALIEGVDIENKLPAMIKQGWLSLNQCG